MFVTKKRTCAKKTQIGSPRTARVLPESRSGLQRVSRTWLGIGVGVRPLWAFGRSHPHRHARESGLASVSLASGYDMQGAGFMPGARYKKGYRGGCFHFLLSHLGRKLLAADLLARPDVKLLRRFSGTARWSHGSRFALEWRGPLHRRQISGTGKTR